MLVNIRSTEEGLLRIRAERAGSLVYGLRPVFEIRDDGFF
jgi:hypothetical protein